MEVRGIESHPLNFTRDGYQLHGTLVLPVTEGAYRPPVFVIAHGSGPRDRDGTATGALLVNYGQEVPTFRLLAEALAGAGAAVYRYDKRTCFRENSEGRCPTSFVDYPGNPERILIDDYIEDFRAAVRAVAAREDVDGSDVTVVGLSQGANFVPLLLADEPGVVAGVQLAGSSLPIDEVLVEQLLGAADEYERRGSPWAEQAPRVREEAERYERAFAEIRAGTYASTHFDNTLVEHWANWMERTDHLREEFTAVTAPILVLHGDHDFNVHVSHLERFQQWATEEGMDNATFSILPGVTHTFVQLNDEGRIREPFAIAALSEILTWHAQR